jgi:hypothetical protein
MVRSLPLFSCARTLGYPLNWKHLTSNPSSLDRRHPMTVMCFTNSVSGSPSTKSENFQQPSVPLCAQAAGLFVVRFIG